MIPLIDPYVFTFRSRNSVVFTPAESQEDITVDSSECSESNEDNEEKRHNGDNGQTAENGHNEEEVDLIKIKFDEIAIFC